MSVFKKDLTAIVLCSLVIAVIMTVAAWDINFWPTDTKVYYFEPALRLPNLKYLSQMHEVMDDIGVRWLHGHEIFILSASIMQRLMNDFETLRPFLVLCVISVFFSSIFIFYLTYTLWGRFIGFLCYVIFITCFWPYQYILFTGHPPLGLFLFLGVLMVLFCMPENKWSFLFYIIAGALFCFAMHSSIIAALYAPYCFAGLLYTNYIRSENRRFDKKLIKKIFVNGLFCILGFICGYLYITFPNVLYNIRSYFEFVEISASNQHFYYNQPVLIQWIPHPELPLRAGFIWVTKFFILIMPVLFPFYIGCILYLIVKCFRSKKSDAAFIVLTGWMIFLSASGIVLPEIRGVAQFARNYFTFLTGLIMLIGYSAFVFIRSDWSNLRDSYLKTAIIWIFAIIGILNLGANYHIFFNDVYPTRMATTYMSDVIREMGLKRIYTYRRHPYRRNMVDNLSPDVLKDLKFVDMQNISQPSEGYILIPPVSGNSIFRAALTTFNDFDSDIFLNELLKKGNIGDYSVASFPTLVSSRIWIHEQETLSYKTLVLNHPVYSDINRTKVWLLDAEKIKRDIKKNVPRPEYIYLHKTGVRNIGTMEPVYRFEGFAVKIGKSTELRKIPARIYKVGNPKDSLIAYVYKVAVKQPVWIPLSENFASLPVKAENITANTRGERIWFELPNAVSIEPGRYKIVIYRTGKPDNKNYYRIYPRR